MAVLSRRARFPARVAAPREFCSPLPDGRWPARTCRARCNLPVFVRSAFGVKAVHDAVFDFIGIAEDVALIKTKNLSEVVHSGDVAVGDGGLDDVFPFASQKFAIEDAIQGRRANLYAFLPALFD